MTEMTELSAHTVKSDEYQTNSNPNPRLNTHTVKSNDKMDKTYGLSAKSNEKVARHNTHSVKSNSEFYLEQTESTDETVIIFNNALYKIASRRTNKEHYHAYFNKNKMQIEYITHSVKSNGNTAELNTHSVKSHDKMTRLMLHSVINNEYTANCNEKTRLNIHSVISNDEMTEYITHNAKNLDGNDKNYGLSVLSPDKNEEGKSNDKNAEFITHSVKSNEYVVYPPISDVILREITDIVLSYDVHNYTSISTSIISNNKSIQYILCISSYKSLYNIKIKIKIIYILSVINTENILEIINIYNKIINKIGKSNAQSGLSLAKSGKSNDKNEISVISNDKNAEYITHGVKSNAQSGKSSDKNIEGGKSSDNLNYLLNDMHYGVIPLNNCRFYYDIIYHTLLEHRLLFISKNDTVLANFIQTIIMSIQPFKWKGILLSNATGSYRKLKETTIPYILGMTKFDPKNIPHKTVIIFIDENKIIISENQRPEITKFISKLYNTPRNRKCMPFYNEIIRKFSGKWPKLKEELNIYMEILMASILNARDKVIKALIKSHNQRTLKDVINNDKFHLEILKEFQECQEFYREFMETSLYQEGIHDARIKKVLCLGVSQRDLLVILWIFMSTCRECIKPTRNLTKIKFVIESYLSQFLVSSYTAADTLLVGLFGILSYFDLFGVIFVVSDVLLGRGIEISEEMCSAFMPAIESKDLLILQEKDSLKKKCITEIRLEKSCDMDYFQIWEEISFTHENILSTINRFICASEWTEEDASIMQKVISGFDMYELPY
ncbi:hypothetical protein NERG_02458 [Nematocida ausubeli]|uniref:cDENN domain-containing protein n=1 Tax=Nematocida ausubeli (strain ATCC PRA-371 / ERTm2) TaxID=1913371 RepID=H8ZFT7_NEMA1|nr:hypothetical protein NERG_02458 [Nematocida ausubeli]